MGEPESRPLPRAARIARISKRPPGSVIHALFRHPHSPVPALVHSPSASERGENTGSRPLLLIRGTSAVLTVGCAPLPRQDQLLLTVIPIATGRSRHWQERVAIVLTPDEILAIFLVLVNVVAHNTIQRCGGAHRKVVAVFRDGEEAYVSAQQGNISCRLQMSLADTIRLSAVLLDKFRGAAPESVRDDLLQLVRLVRGGERSVAER